MHQLGGLSTDNSMEGTPIAKSYSSPAWSTPIQVMSPNLAEGNVLASSSQGQEGPAMEAGVAKAILQQWTEVKDDEGTIARRYTQIAQTWPLEDGSKFEDIEAVIRTLREARGYLHQGMHLML